MICEECKARVEHAFFVYLNGRMAHLCTDCAWEWLGLGRADEDA